MKKQMTLTGLVLAKFGFVHITGLKERVTLEDWHDGKPIQASKCSFGHWDTNGGLMVAVTVDGEVWLSASGDNYSLHKGKTIHDVLREVCPKGKGANVFCSTGSQICTHEILMRLHDPLDDIHGECSPEPNVRG